MLHDKAETQRQVAVQLENSVSVLEREVAESAQEGQLVKWERGAKVHPPLMSPCYAWQSMHLLASRRATLFSNRNMKLLKAQVTDTPLHSYITWRARHSIG